MLLHNMSSKNAYLYIYKNLCKHKGFVNKVDNIKNNKILLSFNYGSR